MKVLENLLTTSICQHNKRSRYIRFIAFTASSILYDYKPSPTVCFFRTRMHQERRVRNPDHSPQWRHKAWNGTHAVVVRGSWQEVRYSPDNRFWLTQQSASSTQLLHYGCSMWRPVNDTVFADVLILWIIANQDANIHKNWIKRFFFLILFAAVVDNARLLPTTGANLLIFCIKVKLYAI